MKISAFRLELSDLQRSWKAIADEYQNDDEHQEEGDWEARVSTYERCAKELEALIVKWLPLRIKPPKRGDGKDWGTRRKRFTGVDDGKPRTNTDYGVRGAAQAPGGRDAK